MALMPHETGLVTIPDYVYQALDLEVQQAPEPQLASLVAAPVAMEVSPAPLAAPIVAVASEFENRISAMERSLAKMSEVIERFIARADTAPIQRTCAPQLPSVSDDADVSIIEQAPEPAHRPFCECARTWAGRRLAKSKRPEHSDALAESRRDDAEEEDTTMHSIRVRRRTRPRERVAPLFPSERSNGAGLSDKGIDDEYETTRPGARSSV